MYTSIVPKLWNDTIAEHRNAVREATLDTTGALVAELGPASVTMSQIAERTGIGRATLYKYFPDIEAILLAWHERQIARHLEHLAHVRDQASDPGHRLRAVLEAYARIRHQHYDDDMAAFLHRGEHVTQAQQHLLGFMADLLAQAARAGEIRADVPPAELAGYCLHALNAAASLPSEAAAERLVTVTLAGLGPEQSTDAPIS
jgi:AcrR family transcriptional regulator